MSTRIAVISLYVEDVPAAAHFYRDVLGLRLAPHHGERPHFDLGGCYLVLLQGVPAPTSTEQSTRFPIIAFAVDDLDAAIQPLRRHQVELPWGVEEDGDSRWVIFHDPAGNLIELVQFSGSLIPHVSPSITTP